MRKLDALALARMIGHRDIKILTQYRPAAPLCAPDLRQIKGKDLALGAWTRGGLLVRDIGSFANQQRAWIKCQL
ncbi:MAG: hypothetical protein AAFY65_17025 [Pseudomonadota bacterium]